MHWQINGGRVWRWRRAALWVAWLSASTIAISAPLQADDAQANPFPEGRIFTSIFWQQEGKHARHVVAIDPVTGKCEIIAPEGLDPRVSPDHEWVAYWTMSPSNDRRQVASEAWVKKLGSNEEPKRVWAGDGHARPVWTRDGKRLIMSASGMREQGAGWKFSTWLVDPETGETEALPLPDSECIIDSAHQSDLLISWSLPKGHIDLVTMLQDGTQTKRLTAKGLSDHHGRFSCDDKKIAFMRRSKGKMSVCTADADGKNVVIAYTEQGLVNINQVCWSPDANRLAVVLNDWSLDGDGNKIMRSGEDHKFRIAIMDLDGGNYHELTLDRAVTEISNLDWR
jgi:Tol biopolymer transport system component